MFKKISLVSQERENDCGLCCISMIMQYFGDKVSINTLSRMVDIQYNGLSIKDIKFVLSSFNYEIKAYKSNIKGIEKINRHPLILHWDNSHYVILEEIKNGKYVIIDPAFGRKKLSYTEFKKHFSEVVLLISPPSREKIKEERNDLYIYKSFIYANKSIFLKFALLIVIDLLIPFAAIITVSEVIFQNSKIPINNKYIYLCTPIYLLLQLMINKRISVVSKKMDEHIYSNIINALFGLPHKYFMSRNIGEIFYRLNVIKNHKEFVVKAVLSFLKNGFIVLCILSIFMYFNVFIFFVILTTNIIVLSLYLYLSLKKAEYLKLEDGENYILQSLEKNILSTFFYLKTMNQEEFNREKIMNQYKATSSIFQKRFLLSENIKLLKSFNLYLVPMITFLTVIEKQPREISSNICLFLLIWIYFFCFNRLLDSSNLYSSFKETLEKTNDILQYTEQSSSRINQKTVNSIQKIEFKNVSFCYPNQKEYTLENVNFKINKGERIILIGPKESGKTTLLALIFGIYKPSKGEIYINDIEIDNIDMSSFQKLVTFIPQNLAVINGTIKDNISMNNDYTNKEIEKVCKEIGLHESIERMPASYDTVISPLTNNIDEDLLQKIICARIMIQQKELVIIDDNDVMKNQKILFNNYKHFPEIEIIVNTKLTVTKNKDVVITLENKEVVKTC